MRHLFLGLDGCREGWVAVVFEPQKGFTGLRIIRDLTDLKTERSLYRRIYVDIPVGLPPQGQPDRECDRAARKLLQRRKSSVFSVPVRGAVFADDYQKACFLNQRDTGRRISKQTWNICSKIRQTDILMRKHPCLKKNVYESHPEICFAALNGMREMTMTKKTPAGQQARLRVLARYAPDARKFFKQAMLKFKCSRAAADDFLDAMVLALSASYRPYRLPARRVYDAAGLPMQIVYPKFEGHKFT